MVEGIGNTIEMRHGSGGKESHRLINNLIKKYFNNEFLNRDNDATFLPLKTNNISITTDSFVITPRFFKGGNIGKLSVCGTINDLAVSGATPKYLTCGLIIEEGFKINELEEIIKSIASEAKKAGVYIVAGDTKVVEKGSVDGIFINTTGIGELEREIIDVSNAKVGDTIIVNGTLGDHGMSIMCSREELNIFGDIESDCATLNYLVKDILEVAEEGIHVMRDATRGGIAAVLNEIAIKSNVTIEINEEDIPVKKEVVATCELLGLEPLSIANEGKIVFFVQEKYVDKVLNKMRNNNLGKNSKVIGKVIKSGEGIVLLNTVIGGKRILDMPVGENLPRIC